VRVVIADDSILVREGIASLLRSAGFEVAAQTASAEDLLEAVEAHSPEVAVVDIRMPPTHTDEGLRAALAIRARHPGTAILILSQHVETGVATRLLAESPAGLGYLLKDRVIDIEDFAGTMRILARGGSALDPQVMERLLGGGCDDGPLRALSAREREVLGLVAQGRSNKAIADRLVITQRAVAKHVTSIFRKLGLPDGVDEHRRVLAVLAHLRPSATDGAASRTPATPSSGTAPVGKVPWADGPASGTLARCRSSRSAT
jgi:DNA-binding NarL/FixJ family response regulator